MFALVLVLCLVVDCGFVDRDRRRVLFGFDWCWNCVLMLTTISSSDRIGSVLIGVSIVLYC